MGNKTRYNKGDEFFSSGRTYTVISCIRTSKISEVYKIERKADNQMFLLKLLNVKEMHSSTVKGNKPAVISYLETSNIAQMLSVYDWGSVDEDCYYLISRYFTKGLLSDRLKQDALKLHTALSIVLDLAKTLSSLQAYDPATGKTRPMRHGDICPNNIMYDFDEKGDYKTYLIDIEHISFIADDKHDAVLLCDLSNVNPLYSAPESFYFEPVYNSDIFSLGIILYECCFGDYPFPYDKEEFKMRLTLANYDVDFQYIYEIMQKTPEYLGMSIDRGVPGALIHLLRGMLELDPAKRLNWTAVINHLSVLHKVTGIHKVELTDERGFSDEVILSLREVSNEFKETYTLSSKRIEKEYTHNLGSLQDSSEADFFDILKEDFGLEQTDRNETTSDDTPSFSPEFNYSPLVRQQDSKARGFKDIAGMDELKEMMKKKVLYFLNNPAVAAEYKIDYPNGMLLYGPPGCGKTFFAEKFAEESGFSYALVKSSDLGSTWIHGTQGKISELFKEARSKAPCVICFDEFDAFAPDRSKIHNANQAGEVNEFLSQLNNCGKDRIFIIATTNNPEGIDSAVLRSGRLEHKVYIPAPDFEARKAVIKMAVLSRPCRDNIDFDRLATLTEGYVTSDLSLIVNDAAMNAAYARSFISQELLEEAISTYKPSVSDRVIKEHEEIHRRMQSDKRTHTRIGFK